MHPLVVPVPEVDAQCIVGLSGEDVDVLVAQPELAVDVSEAEGVVVPPAREVDGAILAALDDRPPALRRVHVAVHVEHKASGQLDRVHTRHVHSTHFQLATVCPNKI